MTLLQFACSDSLIVPSTLIMYHPFGVFLEGIENKVLNKSSTVRDTAHRWLNWLSTGLSRGRS